MMDSANERRIGPFFLRNQLFEQIKGYMQTALGRPVTDDETEGFLSRNPLLLGSIVGYDEVDTEDRNNIWDELREDEILSADTQVAAAKDLR